jgi:hypothetical protein
MPSNTPKDAAIFAAIAKYREVVAEFLDADKRVGENTAKLAQAEKDKKEAFDKVNGCYKTAELFGFDLDAEIAKDNDRIMNELMGDTAGPPAPSPIIPEINVKSKSVRDHILEAAQAAYPKSVRAAALREQLEEKGIFVHEKTVGMTLYRLLKKRFLRRDRWDWYFVPEGKRQTAAPTLEQKSPGSNPGLLQLVED